MNQDILKLKVIDIWIIFIIALKVVVMKVFLAQFHSSKYVLFNEFSVNNSDSILNRNSNEEAKRTSLKKPALRIMMIIKKNLMKS